MWFAFCLSLLFVVVAPNGLTAAFATIMAFFYVVRIFNEPTGSEIHEKAERLRREMEARTRKFEKDTQEFQRTREEMFHELRRRMEEAGREARRDAEFARGQRTRRAGIRSDISNELKHLNLTALPSNKAELKQAWRKAMSDAHPDKPNGSTSAAQDVNAAYDKLLRQFPAREN